MVSRTGTVTVDWDAFFSEQKIQSATATKDIQACVNLFLNTFLKGQTSRVVKLKIGCRFMLHVPPCEGDKIAAALDQRNLWPSKLVGPSTEKFELQNILDTALEEALKAKNLPAAKALFSKSSNFTPYKFKKEGGVLGMILAHLPDQELITLALEQLSTWKALKLEGKAFFQEDTAYRIPLLSSFAKLCTTLPSKDLPHIGSMIQQVIGTPDQFAKASEPEQNRLSKELHSFVMALGYVVDCNTSSPIENLVQSLIGTPSNRRIKVAEAVKLIGSSKSDDFTVVARLSDKKLEECTEFLEFAVDCFELVVDRPKGFPVNIKREILSLDSDLTKLITLCHLHASSEPNRPLSIRRDEVQRIVVSASKLDTHRRKKIFGTLKECGFFWCTLGSQRYAALEFFSRISDLEIESVVKFYNKNNKHNAYGINHNELFEAIYQIPQDEVLEVLQCCLEVMSFEEEFQADLLVKAVRDLPQEKRKAILKELRSVMQDEYFEYFSPMVGLFSNINPDEMAPLFREHRDALISVCCEGADLRIFGLLRTIPETVFSKLCFLYYFQDFDMLGWEGVQKMAEAAALCEDLEEIDFYTLFEEIFSDREFQERTLQRLSERLNDEAHSLHSRYYTALEIIDYDYCLGLHYEHEIYQQALEVLSACDPELVNDPKFPYTLFKKLSLSVPSEPWIAFDVPHETVMLKTLDVSREDTTILKTIPVDVSWDVAAIRALNDWKGYTKEHLRVLLQGFKRDVNLKALLTLIKNFERRLKWMSADEKQVVHDRIMNSYGLTYSKIKEQLLHPQLRKWLNLDETAQVVPTASFQLIAIMRFLIESANEENLLGFGASIGNCDTGQADGISNYYTTFLPLKYKMGVLSNEHSSVDYVEELFKQIFQDELQKVFAGEELARLIVGDDSLEQMSHFARYLKSRFHRQAGLEDTIEFDHHTGVLSNKLLDADPKMVLEDIYRLFSFEKVYQKILYDSVKFLENRDFFPGIQALICRGKRGAKEGMTTDEFIKTREKYFVFNDYEEPLRLTPEGLFRALKALDWVLTYSHS